jgi:predicted O-methyltransferase YrrM
MADPVFVDQLMPYLDGLVPERNEVMQEMEAYAREVGFPIIGTAAGYFLYEMARITGARSVFELGSGYGYSTAWFARAVQENGGGVVHHVVWDEGLSEKAKAYLGRLGYGDIVQFHMGEAVAKLRETEGPFDMMFNDIDKHGYPASIPVIKEKLKPGGILFVDNMLWHGAVFDAADQSENNLGVKEVTRMLTTDPDFISSLIPIRDGVIMAYYQPK